MMKLDNGHKLSDCPEAKFLQRSKANQLKKQGKDTANLVDERDAFARDMSKPSSISSDSEGENDGIFMLMVDDPTEDELVNFDDLSPEEQAAVIAYHEDNETSIILSQSLIEDSNIDTRNVNSMMIKSPTELSLKSSEQDVDQFSKEDSRDAATPKAAHINTTNSSSVNTVISTSQWECPQCDWCNDVSTTKCFECGCYSQLFLEAKHEDSRKSISPGLGWNTTSVAGGLTTPDGTKSARSYSTVVTEKRVSFSDSTADTPRVPPTPPQTSSARSVAYSVLSPTPIPKSNPSPNSNANVTSTSAISDVTSLVRLEQMSRHLQEMMRFIGSYPPSQDRFRAELNAAELNIWIQRELVKISSTPGYLFGSMDVLDDYLEGNNDIDLEGNVNDLLSLGRDSFTGQVVGNTIEYSYYCTAAFRQKFGKIILDNGTVNHLFNTSLRKLFKSIRKLPAERHFIGVGGAMSVSEIGDMNILTDILTSDRCPRNLVSQGQLKDDGFYVLYENEPDKYTISKGKYKLIFEREGRLYVLTKVIENGKENNEALLATSMDRSHDSNKDSSKSNDSDRSDGSSGPAATSKSNAIPSIDSRDPSKSVSSSRRNRRSRNRSNRKEKEREAIAAKKAERFAFWTNTDDPNLFEFFIDPGGEETLYADLDAYIADLEELDYAFLKANFTREEIKRAQIARLYHRLTGHRNEQAELDELRRGGMKNVHISPADIELCRRIFGPCPVCHRAKAYNPKVLPSTRPKSTKPGEVMHMDIFFVAGPDGKPRPIMIFVDEATHKVLLVKSRTRKKVAIQDGIKLVSEWYTSRGYSRVKTIFSDNEKSVHAYSSKFKGRVSFKAAGEHVGLAEAYIGVIKMILRTIIIDLPYNFPMFYLNYLLKEASMLLSLRPTSKTGGVSVMETLRAKPDFLKLKYPFGAYGLATTPSNQVVSDLQPRSAYGLLLSRPAIGDLNFRVLLLDSMQVVSRKTFEVLPFNQLIIDKINSFSEKDVNDADRTDPDPVGGEIIDGVSIQMEDSDAKDTMDLRRVPDHFKDGEVSRGIYNHSLQGEPVAEQIDAVSDEGFAPELKLGSDEIEKLRQNQQSFKMEDSVEYGRGKRLISKPEMLSLVANELYRTKKAVEERMSTKRAYTKHGETAEDSNQNEIKQILEKNTFEPITISDLRKLGYSNKKIIRCFTFFKEKFNLLGTLEKLKARLVAGGQLVDGSDLDDIASPTAKQEIIMLLFGLASYEDMKVSVLDVPSAFLHTTLPEAQRIPMLIGKFETEIIIKLRPEWAKYVRENGELLVLVKGGLYGLPQSPRLWFDALSTAILELGYKQCTMDPCVFIKLINDKEKSYISLHVDDLGHFYTHDYFQNELVEMITQKFSAPTFKTGDEGVYLGLEYKFNRTKKSVTIGMKKYIDKLLTEFNIQKGSKTCCSQNFMTPSDDDPIDAKVFAGAVMSLYYLASRIRRDLLFAVTVMSTRIHCCNKSDEKKLTKIFRYLFETRDREIMFKLDGTDLKFYIDASYAIHPNARSHTGLVVSLGKKYGGPFFARSTVQKLVTLSSYEAELNGVHQNVYWFHLYRNVMSELGYPQTEPSVLYQDNQATILTLNRGNSFKGRSKHIDVRFYYLTDLIREKVIRVEYLPTEEMIADPLTKHKHSLADEPEMKRLQNSDV